MIDAAFRLYHDAIEARKAAHYAMRTNLPYRIVYAQSQMRRAIAKWRQFAEIRRKIQ